MILFLIVGLEVELKNVNVFEVLSFKIIVRTAVQWLVNIEPNVLHCTVIVTGYLRQKVNVGTFKD